MPLNGARPAFFGSVALFLGNRSSHGWQISAAKACEYLDRIAECQRTASPAEPPVLPNPSGLYISGAEPFAQLDDLELLLDCAARAKMPAEVVTTAFWVDSEATANALLERLRKRLHLLTIMTGRGEIDRYGLAALEQLLLAARRFNLSIQIHVGVGPDEPFPKEILGLEVINCDTSVIRVEPVIGGPAPPGGFQWPKGYQLDAPPRFARCAELMGFVIAPNGDVYPCASGVGFPQLRLGNLEAQSVREIMRSAMAKTELVQLRNQGPFFLFEDWRRSPQPAALSGGYLSTCDFHRQLLAGAAHA